MSDKKPYAPTTNDVREDYAAWEYSNFRKDEFDRWLNQVKRDAARVALNGLAMRFERMGDYADLADQPGRPFWEAQDETEEYRDEFYPEDVTP